MSRADAARGAGAGRDAGGVRRRRVPAVRLTDPVIISHPDIMPAIFERSSLVAFIKSGGLTKYGITAANYRDFVVQDQFTLAVLAYVKGMGDKTLNSLDDLEDAYQDPVSYVIPKGDAVFARRDGYLYSLETLQRCALSPFTSKPFGYPGYVPTPSWGLLSHPLYEAIKGKLKDGKISKRELLGLIQDSFSPLEMFNLGGAEEAAELELAKLEEMGLVKWPAVGFTAIQALFMTVGSNYSSLNPYLALPVAMMYGYVLFPAKKAMFAETFNEKVGDGLDNSSLGIVLGLSVLFFSYSSYLAAVNGLLPVIASISIRVLAMLCIITDLVSLPAISNALHINQLRQKVVEADLAKLPPVKQNISKLFASLVALSFASISYEMLGNVCSDRMGYLEYARLTNAWGTFVGDALVAPVIAMITLNLIPAIGFLAQVNQDLQAPKISSDLLISWGPKIVVTGMMAYLQLSAGGSAWESANHTFLTLISLFGDSAVYRVLRADVKKPAPLATDLFKVELPSSGVGASADSATSVPSTDDRAGASVTPLG